MFRPTAPPLWSPTGKAATGSGDFQPQLQCLGTLCSSGESPPPGTVTTLNAKPKGDPSLDPLEQFSQMAADTGRLIHPGTNHLRQWVPLLRNTWGMLLSMKQEANRAATTSHGSTPSLPSREGRQKQKTQRKAKTRKEIRH
ncbi:hypothetical protein AVEN_273828-1 [Araneus ventricosus]|uniref:Uncharacterized protein n=1 Tax=Araneus ventricosus TaxID=182803 RepID=A0A4Y2L0D4_ARAVE|nr:hypothetical protein AVEN_273828-1 [Araneus ventricosus]